MPVGQKVDGISGAVNIHYPLGNEGEGATAFTWVRNAAVAVDGLWNPLKAAWVSESNTWKKWYEPSFRNIYRAGLPDEGETIRRSYNFENFPSLAYARARVQRYTVPAGVQRLYCMLIGAGGATRYWNEYPDRQAEFPPWGRPHPSLPHQPTGSTIGRHWGAVAGVGGITFLTIDIGTDTFVQAGDTLLIVPGASGLATSSLNSGYNNPSPGGGATDLGAGGGGISRSFSMGGGGASIIVRERSFGGLDNWVGRGQTESTAYPNNPDYGYYATGSNSAVTWRADCHNGTDPNDPDTYNPAYASVVDTNSDNGEWTDLNRALFDNVLGVAGGGGGGNPTSNANVRPGNGGDGGGQFGCGGNLRAWGAGGKLADCPPNGIYDSGGVPQILGAGGTYYKPGTATGNDNSKGRFLLGGGSNLLSNTGTDQGAGGGWGGGGAGGAAQGGGSGWVPADCGDRRKGVAGVSWRAISLANAYRNYPGRGGPANDVGDIACGIGRFRPYMNFLGNGIAEYSARLEGLIEDYPIINIPGSDYGLNQGECNGKPTYHDPLDDQWGGENRNGIIVIQNTPFSELPLPICRAPIFGGDPNDGRGKLAGSSSPYYHQVGFPCSPSNTNADPSPVGY